MHEELRNLLIMMFREDLLEITYTFLLPWWPIGKAPCPLCRVHEFNPSLKFCVSCRTVQPMGKKGPKRGSQFTLRNIFLQLDYFSL